MDVLRKCEADPLAICTVPRLYWADRKFERLEHAVSVGLDLGDAWGRVAQIRAPTWDGAAAQQENVIVRCQAAKPNHGETWQTIAKDDNTGESPGR